MTPILFALASLTAHAATDLSVSVSVPAGAMVYAEQVIRVTATNHGARTADGVVVDLDLPETGTSPQNHVFGQPGALDPRCTRTGTTVRCALGSLRRGRSASVDVRIAFPWSATPLDLAASVSTTSGDPNPANDDAFATATTAFYAQPTSGPATATNHHCSGTDLRGWYLCTLFPSAIQAHGVALHAGGTLDFDPVQPGYTGTWSQPFGPESLRLDYSDGLGVVATFEGHGVGGDCFEGLTTFPGSTSVAAYEVCLD